MFNTFCSFVTILLLTSNVAISQYEYDYYGELDDPYIDYQHKQSPYNNERGPRYKVSYFRKLSEDKEANKGRGVVGDAFGKASVMVSDIIGSGKCMIKCVTAWVKTCGGIISCPWNCLFPDKKLPAIKRRQDEDIVLKKEPDLKIEVAQAQQNSNPNILMPTEIVMLAKCWIECLNRYLPRDISTLTQMMTCVITRCLCGAVHYG